MSRHLGFHWINGWFDALVSLGDIDSEYHDNPKYSCGISLLGLSYSSMDFLREISLPELLQKKSFFLFGARSTGKTTLIEKQLDNAKVYDLLDDKTYQKLARNPALIEEENKSQKKIIVIDEIQKLPKILDEVHRLIKKYNFRFLLTGSSARKLRKGGANLLGGRAWQANLYPLTFKEIGDFDLLRYLNRGGLPAIYNSEFYQEELQGYVNLYLREEIVSEAIVKKYEYFLRFLDVIALSNGQELNYENIANDAGVPPRTVQNYVQILSDTLVGMELKPYLKTVKRKAITRSKFYLFDIGVTNYLAKRSEIIAGNEIFGFAFEHFIILEINAYLSYRRKNLDMYYWRSTSGFEVDCIIGNEIAIEIKSSNFVHKNHFKGLRALQEEQKIRKHIVVSQDNSFRQIDAIAVYPWQKFLEKLWADKLV